jgi:hypothetical protein
VIKLRSQIQKTKSNTRLFFLSLLPACRDEYKSRIWGLPDMMPPSAVASTSYRSYNISLIWCTSEPDFQTETAKSFRYTQIGAILKPLSVRLWWPGPAPIRSERSEQRRVDAPVVITRVTVYVCVWYLWVCLIGWKGWSRHYWCVMVVFRSRTS